MKFSRKLTICLICLFVFSFKIAASNIFIDKGLDRAESISYLQKVNNTSLDSATLVKHIKVDFSLNLMSHVVGNLSSVIDIADYLLELGPSYNSIEISYIAKNIQEAIYKPPKA